jgi:hypothetical protein
MKDTCNYSDVRGFSLQNGGNMKYFIFVLFLVCMQMTPAHARQTIRSYEGYWIYGFEQSIFESCTGERYWMWAPKGFAGKYTMEGYPNPVQVDGELHSPDPTNNMNSTLKELKVAHITHLASACN